MDKMSSVKRMCVTAVCIALCCVLPLAFHAAGLGYTFSPMHIPVLLCGLVCGGGYGLLCGLLGPVLSCVITSMPAAAGLITMVPELMVYGLASGLAMKYLRTGRAAADIYISLIGAMLLGRVVGGVASAIFYMGTDEPFSIAVWASSYFVGTAPGIVVQLILIPALVFALTKARVIPARYPQKQGVPNE